MKYTAIYQHTGTFTVHAETIRDAIEKAERQKPANSTVVEVIPVKKHNNGSKFGSFG